MIWVWKLLRCHISVAQLAGFFLANLLGMFIVLLSVQLYSDILPVFSQKDGFIKEDYIIVSKRIQALDGFTGRSSGFSSTEINELRAQSFCKAVGTFTASQYQVRAGMGIQGIASFSTEMFFESVPDAYVDVSSSQWHFDESSDFVPIILPRNYLAIYNFGFAQSRALPKLSEGVVAMVDIDLWLRGAGAEKRMRGRVIGFSNRLNTILVPETFMRWSNTLFAPHADASPTRLIVSVTNPANEEIVKFMKQKGYELDEDKLAAGRTTYFLKIVAGVVLTVGLLISFLSFYILMLSVYLLVQKNTAKLENLLLMGYSPAQVSLPYQAITVGLNALVLLLAYALLLLARNGYMNLLWALFPQMPDGSVYPSLLLGGVLFLAVSVFNVCAVRKKIMAVWLHKD